mmetsp:Transcript_55256/g.127052  ORF Transcript_55256/g.127052 Transcript_55256/m.127052 type:complete len:214 (-) Transcript_55256:778-1419(-)
MAVAPRQRRWATGSWELGRHFSYRRGLAAHRMEASGGLHRWTTCTCRVGYGGIRGHAMALSRTATTMTTARWRARRKARLMARLMLRVWSRPASQRARRGFLGRVIRRSGLRCLPSLSISFPQQMKPTAPRRARRLRGSASHGPTSPLRRSRSPGCSRGMCLGPPTRCDRRRRHRLPLRLRAARPSPRRRAAAEPPQTRRKTARRRSNGECRR